MGIPEGSDMKAPGDSEIPLGAYLGIFRKTNSSKQDQTALPDCLKGGQMVITSTLSYPTESANEIGKRFKDLPPQPSFITWKGPYIRSEVDLGFKVFSIYEFDQSKMAEVLESIGTRMAQFIGVPGFTYSLDVWLEVKEGLKLIGMG